MLYHVFSLFYLSVDFSSTEAEFPGVFSPPDIQRRAGPISPTLLLFQHYFGHEGGRKGTKTMPRVQGHNNNLRKCFFHSQKSAHMRCFPEPISVPCSENLNKDRQTNTCSQKLLSQEHGEVLQVGAWTALPQPEIDVHGPRTRAVGPAAPGDRAPDKQHRADGEGRAGRKEPESCSPLLPRRLRGCIIIPVEPIKLVELIVLQITELRPAGLAGLTSHASSGWSKIPWKNPANEWRILSHRPHVWFFVHN